MTTYFTSESVTQGHPDKVCDQIADAILDAVLADDPYSHVACEVTAITDAVHIFGEITTAAKVDYEAVARETIRAIGYTRPGHGFDADSCRVTIDLHEQSPDINMGVTREKEEESGAGDQGMMFGYLARYLAKNVVAAGLAECCEVQLSYAIGVAQPVSLLIDTFGTETIPVQRIRELILDTVDMRPAAIIRRFGLRAPMYGRVSCYGHFGENAKEMPWEQNDLAALWVEQGRIHCA